MSQPDREALGARERPLAHRFLRAALKFLAVAIPLGGLVLGLFFWNDFTGKLPWLGGNGVPLPSRFARDLPVESSALATEATCSEPEALPLVLLVAHSWEPHGSTLIVDEQVCFPPQLFFHLHNQRGEPLGDHVAHGPPEPAMLRQRFANLKLGVFYTPVAESPSKPRALSSELLPPPPGVPSLSFLPEGAPTPRHEVYLEELLQARGHFLKLGSLTLRVTGTPPLYPFDRYATSGVLGLGVTNVPSSEAIFLTDTLHGARIENGLSIPFHLRVAEGSAIAPLTLAATTSRSAAIEQELGAAGEATHELGLRMKRWTVTELYVLLVLMVPLVLEVLLVIVLVRRQPGPEFLAGIAAVLLAILPIRQVLVPSGIEELTFVDYWLGFEVALLAAVACVAVRRML